MRSIFLQGIIIDKGGLKMTINVPYKIFKIFFIITQFCWEYLSPLQSTNPTYKTNSFKNNIPFVTFIHSIVILMSKRIIWDIVTSNPSIICR